MRAYALMRHPAALEASYLASPQFSRARTQIEALRSELSVVPFKSYRGIGRYPFSEIPDSEPGWQWDTWELTDSEPEARALLGQLLGPDDYLTSSPRAFLSEPEHAREVCERLIEPERFEVVELCTLPDHPSRLFGFDVGYWGGGNFSILCDAAIWPLWHPPAPGSFTALANATNSLNRHALFPTVSSAQRYLNWYATQEWAEPDFDEFMIIAVGAFTAALTPPLA